MKKPTHNKMGSVDAEIEGELAALRRAARAARRLAEQTGTPFYVMRGGRIVNLNRIRRKGPSTRSTRARKSRLRPEFAEGAMRELRTYRKTHKAAHWMNVKRKLGL